MPALDFTLPRTSLVSYGRDGIWGCRLNFSGLFFLQLTRCFRPPRGALLCFISKVTSFRQTCRTQLYFGRQMLVARLYRVIAARVASSIHGILGYFNCSEWLDGITNNDRQI